MQERIDKTLTFTDREYLPSGVNVFTNSLKILDTDKTKFFELNFFQMMKKHDETTSVQIWVVFVTL